MIYTGIEPFANLTAEQVQTIEEAISRAPDPAWHDGIWRELRARLEGEGPWSDDKVRVAAKQALADLGITLETAEDDNDDDSDDDDDDDESIEEEDEPIEEEDEPPEPEPEAEPELEEAESEPKPKRRSAAHHAPKRKARR